VSERPDPTNWVCPLPLRDTSRIVLGHGGGGILSEELIENLFLPAFGSAGGPSRDSAVLAVPGGRIALGDVIVALDGATVRSADDVTWRLDDRQPGETVTLTLESDGRTRDISLAVAGR